jgi:hypothetical protein
VALSVSFSVSLRHRGACCEQAYSQHGGHPFRRGHGYAPPKAGSSILAL